MTAITLRVVPIALADVPAGEPFYRDADDRVPFGRRVAEGSPIVVEPYGEVAVCLNDGRVVAMPADRIVHVLRHGPAEHNPPPRAASIDTAPSRN